MLINVISQDASGGLLSSATILFQRGHICSRTFMAREDTRPLFLARTGRYIFLIILMVVPVAVFAAADHDITLTLSSATVQPGDLVSLRAKLRSATYAAFVFSMPPHANLRRVSVESGVVHYSDGIYEQEHLWLFQTVSSGDVIFDEVHAQVKHGGEETVYALPVLRLQILPYASMDEVDEPADLPVAALAETVAD